MIIDGRTFRPEFVPRDLVHREEQINYLSSVFDPLTKGRQAEHACIHGPPGAGKTTLAKYVLEDLTTQNSEIRWGYVNCNSDSTPKSVLYRLVRHAVPGANLQPERTTTAAALDYFYAYNDQFILIIDEVDILDDSDTLLELYKLPNVTLVCITHEQAEWLADMDSQAESRFRSTKSLHLKKYGHNELVDILESRAEQGLVRSRVKDAAIEKIADIAAGDAHHGIMLLHRAAQRASHEECDLTTDIVDSKGYTAKVDLEN